MSEDNNVELTKLRKKVKEQRKQLRSMNLAYNRMSTLAYKMYKQSIK